MVYTTRLDTYYSCKVWMKSHQLFMRSFVTDGRTDRQIDDREVLNLTITIDA